MKTFKFLILMLFAVSCNTPRAVYDYDQQADFSSLHTYKIYPDLVSKMSQLDEQRMLDIINSEMPVHGFNTSENPDIYVNFYASSYQTAPDSNLGVGVGGGGGNLGVGISGGIPLGGPQTVLKITFDFINPQKDALIWEAVVESKFNFNAAPQKRTEQLRAMFQKALEKYPPKK